VNDEAALVIGIQPRRKSIPNCSQSVLLLSQVPLAEPQLAQHEVRQAGPELSASVFEHGKAIAEIERTVTTLAAFLLEPDGNPSLVAEPSQSAQQLVSGHAPSIKIPVRRRQSGNRTFLVDEQRAGW
jgi:hypothetical protein